MLRQCAKTATTILHAASINFAMPAMLGRLVAQLKMPRLDAYGQGTFNPGACAPPRHILDDAVSPSTIRLKRASTIAEIRTLPWPGSSS